MNAEAVNKFEKRVLQLVLDALWETPEKWTQKVKDLFQEKLS